MEERRKRMERQIDGDGGMEEQDGMEGQRDRRMEGEKDGRTEGWGIKGQREGWRNRTGGGRAHQCLSVRGAAAPRGSGHTA